MEFDYSKLKGKIKEIFGTQEAFAKSMKISNVSMSVKLNNKSEWTQQEIIKASSLLGIKTKEIDDYFFNSKS